VPFVRRRVVGHSSLLADCVQPTAVAGIDGITLPDDRQQQQQQESDGTPVSVDERRCVLAIAERALGVFAE